jgi:murein DD-endopeptidase MepM/ murein hydrolase activator NlpD
LIAAVLLLLEPAGAVRARKKPRRPAPAPAVAVTPGRDIETQIVAESARAENILNELRPDNVLDSPYLVSAIYYHDGIFDRFTLDRAEADPADRVVAHITRLLTPERKHAYVDLLRALARSQMAPSPPHFVLPVTWSEAQAKRGRWRWGLQNHKNAIDLFVKEGSPVYAAAGGLVVLPEGNWSADQPFSTSSLRGGNAVIVFDPSENRFYRYCHLERVMVGPGAFVEAGRQIGIVGHTGFNASRPGHGGHLHFEINQYEGGAVAALTDKELRAWLSARSTRGPLGARF